MSRDFKVFLEDILDAVQRIREYTSGISSSQFSADNKTFDAVIRNLEIIGEATKNVPQAVRDKNPRIEWTKMAGLRDILIHEYFGVDSEIVWDIVENKLPTLEAEVRRILSE